MPDQLPIFEIEEELVTQLAPGDYRRLILEAPTGSGKSTQVPQMLLDRGVLGPTGQVVVLQPRRVAARMLARRVASERRVQCGDEVGFQVRFANQTSSKTRIRYVTEGVLLRQMLENPNLDGVSAIVFDEFHERHFFGDITLARARQIQEERRPDLALLVMSATLDGEQISEWLDGAPRLTSEGRTYPVDIRYSPPRERQKGEIWDHIARVYAEHVRETGETCDALVFLPGAYEIRKTIEAFRRESWARHIEILPLHGDLGPRDQDRAVMPSDKPKIVVATNVAETSLTIGGIKLVIDSGLARMSDFDTRRGINTLTIQKISQASADQRAGRAGRTSAGTCIRLWSEADHARRPLQTVPEIQRMDLAEVALTLKAQGVKDLDAFGWFEKPDDAGLKRAIAQLKDLGALHPKTGAITDLGYRLAKFPVTPRYGRVLIEAVDFGCFDAMTEVVAMTQGKSIFVRRKTRGSDLSQEDFIDPSDQSDFQPALRALRAARDFKFDPDQCARLGIHGRAAGETERLARLLQKHGPAEDSTELTGDILARCLLAGFPDQVAVRLNMANRACALVGGRRGRLSDESCVEKSELFVTTEIAEIEGREVNVVLNLNTAITREMLSELHPGAFSEGESADWDPRERRVVALKAVKFRDLILESKPGAEPPRALAAELLAREVAAGNLVLKMWDRSVEQWIARLNTLAVAMPEYELPQVGEDDRLAIYEQICLGSFTYKQIKEKPVMHHVKSVLAPHQQGLIDRYAPDRMELPNGKRARIRYSSGDKPVLSAQLQHLYDVKQTPTVADGRIKLKVEILAPNQRPVQITEDLAGFWENSYAAVKNELKGRYPKHEWR